MKLYIIFIIVGGLFFLSSLIVWFQSGLKRKKNKDGSKKRDKVGGYLFMYSLLIFVIALLLWLLG